MAVFFRMRPNDPPMTWEDFCKDKIPFSIALDGYVKTGPRFDEQGPRVNFNHHEEVDRLATRATCAQVLMAIRQGLFETFTFRGMPYATVFANDCDEDVCTSWFLLSNSHLVRNAINPLVNRLVGVEELMDTTAGAYPLPPKTPVLEELAWVFEPYRRFRISGEIDKRDTASFEVIVSMVCSRIMEYITGRGQRLALDTRYEKIGGGRGWSLVKEVGANAKTGMFADGIKAYVTVRELPDERWAYTVGRVSQFIKFDVLKILSVLSHEELGNVPWGGGNTIGGSPRSIGSRLPPDIVTRIINSTIS